MKKKKKEEGQSLVEFALTLPIWITIAFAIIAVAQLLLVWFYMGIVTFFGAMEELRWDTGSAYPNCEAAVVNEMERINWFLDQDSFSYELTNCPSTNGTWVAPKTKMSIKTTYMFKPYFWHTFLDLGIQFPVGWEFKEFLHE